MKRLLALLAIAFFSVAIAADPASAPIVSTVTIQLQLNQEQVDALAVYLAEWNGTSGTSTLQQRILEDVIHPWVKTKTDASYESALKRLGEAAKSLSYAERQGLIQQVRAQIQNQ